MTKSKSSASSMVVPLFFVIHLLISAQYLNDTCIVGAAVTVLLLSTKM